MGLLGKPAIGSAALAVGDAGSTASQVMAISKIRRDIPPIATGTEGRIPVISMVELLSETGRKVLRELGRGRIP
jgi:hypothetical protein